MLTLTTLNQFEKDVKKSKKRGKDLVKLWSVVDKLLNGKTLPVKNKNHKLSGNWYPHFECHIEPDWLLIYLIEDNTLTLVRTGTHSDLF